LGGSVKVKAGPRRWGFKEILARAYRGMKRKRRPGGFDPNDRDYDPEIHKVLRRLDPIDEHELLNESEEEPK
jgi:hypothetical protein